MHESAAHRCRQRRAPGHDLRLAGNYDDATRILSQLMLVAADDPRVVSEYGKTLLQRGRTQDAVQFLSRAVQLDATDWTTYSALGVAYDQVSDARSAKDAYEHALALQPNEASVLSNYALSRMLAHDDHAGQCPHARSPRQKASGGTADPKIARNIAMIEIPNRSIAGRHGHRHDAGRRIQWRMLRPSRCGATSVASAPDDPAPVQRATAECPGSRLISWPCQFRRRRPHRRSRKIR